MAWTQVTGQPYWTDGSQFFQPTLNTGSTGTGDTGGSSFTPAQQQYAFDLGGNQGQIVDDSMWNGLWSGAGAVAPPYTTGAGPTDFSMPTSGQGTYSGQGRYFTTAPTTISHDFTPPANTDWSEWAIPLLGSLFVGGAAGGAFGGAGAAGGAMPGFTSGLEGLTGTAGDFGASAADLGMGGATAGGLGLGSGSDLWTQLASDAGSLDQTFNINPADWGVQPEGGSWFGGSMMPPADPSGMNPNMIETGTPNWNPSASSSFMQDLMNKFGDQKDPLKALMSLAQLYGNSQQKNKQQQFLNTLKGNQFPYQNFQGLATAFADPAKRYVMLQAMPGFQASQAYAQQVQERRNARTGDINSGFGAATTASVLGQNAAAWDKQNFDQIAQMTGMGVPSGYAQAGGSVLNNMYTNNLNTMASVANAVRSNQGYFPEFFKTFFA